MQITPRIHTLTIPFIVPPPAGPLHRSVSVFLHCVAKINLIDIGVGRDGYFNATDLPANSMSR